MQSKIFKFPTIRVRESKSEDIKRPVRFALSLTPPKVKKNGKKDEAHDGAEQKSADGSARVEGKDQTQAQGSQDSKDLAGKDAAEAGKLEADSGSGFAQVLRKKESVAVLSKVRFIEGAAENDSVDFTRFRCVLIEEGMGNMRDAFYYSREALESAAQIFEGKKIFADHPTEAEDQMRPERSVRDILGHFENVELVEEDGRSHLEADVVILPNDSYKWARSLLAHAVEYAEKYPDKEFIGLSINASGSAEPKPVDEVLSLAPEASKEKIQKAMTEFGISEVKYVSMIDDAVSCDLVTEAGAGGKILQMIEQEKTMAKKAKTKESEAVKEMMPPAAEAEAAPAPEQAPKHDDEAQDIELIKKMIAKYLGDEKGEMDEASESYKEAEALAAGVYKKAKEKGMDEEMAMKCAEVALEYAKECGEAKEAAPVEEKPEGEEKKEEPKENMEQECKKEEAKEGDVKESAQVVALTGKIAFLETEMKKMKMEKHLNELCEKSGLPMSATKKFRSLEAVAGAKSEKDVEQLMNVFKESFSLGGGKAKDAVDFFIQMEKQSIRESDKKEVTFEDCLK